MMSRCVQVRAPPSINKDARQELPERNIVLSIKDLSLAYKTGAPVIGPLSLDVAKGEFVSIVGPSGCGKTTLLNCVGGHLMPTGGLVLIDGTTVDRPLPQIGTVFQKPNLFPWLSVLDNVRFGLRMRKVPAAKESANCALDARDGWIERFRTRTFIRTIGRDAAKSRASPRSGDRATALINGRAPRRS